MNSSRALPELESLLIAVASDRETGDVLHHKIRLAVLGFAGIEDFGDGRMVH